MLAGAGRPYRVAWPSPLGHALTASQAANASQYSGTNAGSSRQLRVACFSPQKHGFSRVLGSCVPERMHVTRYAATPPAEDNRGYTTFMANADPNAEFEKAFEIEVRRVAESLWPQSKGGPAADAGRERDGVYVSAEAVYLIEATVSARADKAQKDCKKLADLILLYRKRFPDRIVKGYFIVAASPNRYQIEEHERVLKNNRLQPYELVIQHFEAFRRRLIDVNAYLEVRRVAPFGSVADPRTGNNLDHTAYVAPDFLEAKTGKTWSVEQIADALASRSGKRFLLLGDYGAGKSMTLRQVFRLLVPDAVTGKTSRFPVALNLREHYGQIDPVEALMRHASSIGFDRDALIRAWRAGYTTLLLDGFDELSTARVVGSAAQFRSLRYSSAELIRNFIHDTPAESGIIVTGREHYFDNAGERDRALGTTVQFATVSLNEFTDEQIAAFLKQQGVEGRVPSWLPSKPLLLGYLAANGLLTELTVQSKDLPPADAWDFLLSKICERESRQAGLDPLELREILERLATRARTSNDGIGPLFPDEIWQTFAEVTGRSPDDRASVQLQRLPGLGAAVDTLIGVQEADSQSRAFVDDDLADAARAGDVVRFISSPFDFTNRANLRLGEWKCGLRPLGVDVCLFRLKDVRATAKQVASAAVAASNMTGGDRLAMDIVQSMAAGGFGFEHNGQCTITNVDCDMFRIDEDMPDLQLVHFVDCVFDVLVVERALWEARSPRFRGCLIDTLEGSSSLQDIGMPVFDAGCRAEKVIDRSKTTAGLLGLPMSAKCAVLLTILKKLYLQSGRGRAESALNRGLNGEQRGCVRGALEIAKSNGVAIKSSGSHGDIWLPNRSQRARVLALLASPMTSSDPMILEAKSSPGKS